MEIEKKVADFIDVCARMVGENAKEDFIVEMDSAIIYDYKGKISSPIEQYLYVALLSVARLNHSENLTIHSQYEVGKYRADFLVSLTDPDASIHRVIIECDSQAFHDRTERERRYEKARERFFVMNGYKVMHYTGTEILTRPIATASEIIGFLSGTPADMLSSWVAEFNDALQ